MTEQRDFIGLDWVIGEIESTLTDARQNLEQYADSDGDLALLEKCRTKIQQIHSTLEVLKQRGARLLTREILLLLESQKGASVKETREQLVVLIQAMLQIPGYLTHTSRTGKDTPGLLKGLLSEMRMLRGLQALTEIDFFTPTIENTIEPIPEHQLDKLRNNGFALLVRKIRQKYQLCLAGVLRDSQRAQQLAVISKIFAKLQNLCWGSPISPLWDACTAFTEGLQETSIALDNHAIKILRQLDSELKNLARNDVKQLNTAPSEELLRELLYRIGKAKSDSSLILSIQRSYSLEKALEKAVQSEPQDANLISFDTAAPVVKAIKEELSNVKDALDLYLLNPQTNKDRLLEQLPTCKQIADTLSMLGLNKLQNIMQQESQNIQAIAANDIPPKQFNDTLISAAAQLLEVEAGLNQFMGFSRSITGQPTVSAQMNDIHQTVIHEARANLELVKGAVVDYLGNEHNQEFLAKLPPLLDGIQGGLAIIPLTKMAEITARCSSHISSQWLKTNHKPSLQALETLADTLSSIEYYLEQLSAGATARAEKTLDLTQENLDKLERLMAPEPLQKEAPKAEAPEPEELIAESSKPQSLETNPFNEWLLSDEEKAEPKQQKENTELKQQKEKTEDILEFTTSKPAATTTPELEKQPQYDQTIEFTTASLSTKSEVQADVADTQESEQPEIGEVVTETENTDALTIDFTLDEQEITALDTVAPAEEPAYEELEFVLDDVFLEDDGAIEIGADYATSDTNKPDNVSEDSPLTAEALKPDTSLPVVGDETVNEEDSIKISAETDSNIDDEIHDIFVEEATEVQQELKRNFPLLSRNYSDALSIDNIRRAFHTLKGSGRMVGANVIGELAWSAENMLNKVIDGSISVSEPMIKLLGEVIIKLPELVQDFAQGSQQLTPEVLLSMEKADALAKDVSFTIDTISAPATAAQEPEQTEPAMLFGNLVDPVENSNQQDELVDNVTVELTPADTIVEVTDQEAATAEILLEPAELTVEATATDSAKRYPATADEIVAEDAGETLEQIIAEPAEISPEPIAVAPKPAPLYDQQLLEIFDNEARAHLGVVKDFIAKSYELGGNIQISDSTQRALHTLKGSAFMAEITPLAELIAAIEKTIKELRAHQIPADNQVISMLEQGVDLVENALLQLQSSPQTLCLKAGSFLNWLKALHQQRLSSIDSEQQPARQPQGQQASLFLASDLNLLLDANEYLQAWVEGINRNSLDQFKFELKLLANSANDVGLKTMYELCGVLLDVCHYLEDEPALPQRLLQPFNDGFEALVEMMNQVASQQTPERPQAVFSALRQALESLFPEQPTNLDEADLTPRGEATEILEQELADSALMFTPDVAEEIILSSTRTLTQPASSLPFVPVIEEADRELQELFIEEAYELLEDSAEALESWLTAPHNLQPVHELQRNLHTLKGGANMAELKALGSLSHALEDIYESITTGKCAPEKAPLGLIQKTHDTIEIVLRALNNGQAMPDTQLMLAELNAWKNHQRDASAIELPDYLGGAVKNRTPTPPEVVQTPQTVLEPVSTVHAKSEPEQPEEVSTPLSASEMIRIPSELIETLINLAGETSIDRSRLEQQTADASRTLEEMNRTIQRVREQLRRLDIETQTQIISRHQGDLGGNPDFDPLEMDQYSELSQLSRALYESASDLIDLREALQEKSRDTETLLQQQARTQIELQEQLMKARMVSFSRLVPRLRKIVRQLSDELHKPVELIISNAEGEMDRTMLERILAPLEHMLRNALSHGIENTPEERKRVGKPETGQIQLSIHRDGADVVVELSDDGRGINIEAVKAKAVRQKMVDPDAIISDQEALELIMKSGFTTADNVTHISGRGVGMDVVNNTVRQIGGSVQVKSEAGQGTHFSLRLPFTLSINRALMVEVGSSLYALPMHTIDGIAMVPSTILADCYRNQAPLVYGNGTEYQLIYMGALVGSSSSKVSDDQCPVILVQRGSENIAVQVDTVVGSREIITKCLGPQFSGLPGAGVNGVTILGDGRVVIILDPAALYHKHQTSKPSAVDDHDNNKANQAIRVLIVDDSVTVRKVTERLLARQGYEVDSARDGVEAMTKLAEQKPDIMLLDIEMPRMDGFEVASAVRNAAELQDLPIIMITSRTGEKHRKRAFSLGVNEYIGKPFQEAPLLAAIEKLTAAETARAS